MRGLSKSVPDFVQDYFQQVHRITIKYPELLGVETCRGEVLPLELCEIVPGQPYRKRATPKIMQQLLSMSKDAPIPRLKKIEDGIRVSLDPIIQPHPASIRHM